MNIFWKLPQIFWDDEGGGGGGGDVDLGDVIESSIADSTGEEEPPAEGAPEEEAELVALEKELSGKNPNIAKQTITASRHQAVLTRQRNQAEAAQKALQAQYDKAQKDAQELAWARDPEIQASLQALALAGSSPKDFVQLLLRDPQYQQLIALKEAQQEAAQQPASNRPKPNARTADGQYEYYDDAGLEELLKWHGSQIQNQTRDEVLKAVEQRYGPMAERFEVENIWNDALERNRGVLENARASWPGFKENEAKIKAAWSLPQNEGWSLHDAYREIVVKEFQGQGKASREAMRKELLAEMNRKPGAVGEKPGGAPERRANPAGKRDLEDVIRESMRGV